MTNRRTIALCAAISLVFTAIGTTVGVALASHDWSDVPDANFFHDAIDEISGAGCARGFPDGTFLPEDGVKRQQFAFWMNNCGGRVASAEADPGFDFITHGNLIDDLVELEIETGGAPDTDGFGLLFVIAEVDIETSGIQQTTWQLQRDQGGGVFQTLDEDRVSVASLGVLPDALQPSDGTTLTGFVPSEAGTLESLRVTVERENGAPNAILDARLTAMYFPFDGLGEAFAEPPP